MSPIVTELPVLVINPHSLCNCRCAMCEIWKRKTADEIDDEKFDAMLPDIERLGVRWVVFSGGEPLLHAGLFRKAEALRRRGIRVTLLSSGLLLRRFARHIAENIDDVIVSLDGPPDVHNRIRGVARAFELIEEGVAAIRAARPGFPVSARCTVQRFNCGLLVDTADAAQRLGLHGISYLAADVHSEAFNRQSDSSQILPAIDDLLLLEAQLSALDRFGAFVAESRAKRDRILRHFRACLQLDEPAAPVCNAPWVSAVIEADGSVRPCFFHKPIGRINGMGLLQIVNGPEAVAFRSSLHVDRDSICRRCVCSLNWTGDRRG